MSEGEPHKKGDELTKSDVAQRLDALKLATIRAAEKRARLPQPLFWSLFSSEIKEIREAKKRVRDVNALLGKL